MIKIFPKEADGPTIIDTGISENKTKKFWIYNIKQYDFNRK